MKMGNSFVVIIKIIFKYKFISLCCLFLLSCTEHIVYKQSNGSDQNQIFSLSSDQKTPLMIVSASDALIPCGPTNDGRIIFTRLTPTGGDIYAVNAENGTGLIPILASSDDEQCVYVTPDNKIIYQYTVPAWNGRHNLMAIDINNLNLQNVATEPYDQVFKAYASDKSIIYLRKTPLPAYAYDLMAAKAGSQPVMLSQVFPPKYRQPLFNAVTENNKVIFSEYTEYQQDKVSQSIFSISTNGSNPQPIAKNPPANEIFCALTYDNRILYTERATYVVNGTEYTSGDIFVVNPDGSNRVLLNQGSPYNNDLCVGVTPDNHVLFIRASDKNRNEGIGSLYSLFANGGSQPILLAATTSDQGTTITNIFEKVTPSNRVLFRSNIISETPHGTTYTSKLNSIHPDGTGYVSLATNYNIVQGIANGDRVIFNSQVDINNPEVTMNLFTVPADGSAVAAPIAPTSQTQDLSFIFYH